MALKVGTLEGLVTATSGGYKSCELAIFDKKSSHREKFHKKPEAGEHQRLLYQNLPLLPPSFVQSFTQMIEKNHYHSSGRHLLWLARTAI